ncbi:MAG: Eco57I restriction-modification methylase domain-containing protein [Verrucomicrobiota bacterium]
MNTQQARALVKETFPQAFDKVRFHQFVKELLNGFNEDKSSAMQVPDAYADHIRSCARLGTYQSPDGEMADVLIVHTTEPWKLERTRTALRDFVGHKLKRGDSYKEAGLVAFVAPDARTWRFSFVRMEYETKRDPKTGKIAAEERLTPARRYSYLVGGNESCHTAQSRFLDLLQDTENLPTLEQIEDAFSVEAVTKEFFEQYKALFLDLKDELDDLAKRDKTIGAEFAGKQVSTADFAKKLMGQIVFLYFLQKKGWLGVPKGGNWGDGPHNFLRQLFVGQFRSYKNFFNDILEPLFYDTLATDRGQEAWCKIFGCRIPFLNGGLFEPVAGYNWQKTDIIISNSLFSNTKSTDAGDTGTGILDVFDRYNFTVNEAEPLEKEVAIDPEMLGKVFENLLEVKERKSKGSFYTPREIVHYMCQESLINYLDTALNSESGSSRREEPHSEKPAAENQSLYTSSPTGAMIHRADLETFIHSGDHASYYEAARVEGTGYKRNLPKIIETHARLIDDKLADIAVCDPAIGSGAFPVGMMQEIVRARMALTPYFNAVQERTPYHFKRHAIQNCLYGVDIDPGAVEIAKLRLWLSLVVDEDDVKQIKPLPNLDYKIVNGNSLLGVDKNELENWQAFHRLEEIKPKYFDEAHGDKKHGYKRDIDKLIHQLTNGKSAFDFEIYFSEIFHRKKGFDVVIGNPPYVRQEAIKNLKPALKAEGYECYTGTADLYVYFFERGVRLLRSAGTLAYISSNSFLNSGFGENLRRYLSSNTRILQLIDFAETKVFEAITEPCVICLTRDRAVNHETKFLKWEQSSLPERIKEVFATRSQTIPQRELKAESWQLESPVVLRLLTKLRCVGKPLGTHVNGRFYRGILTGLNEAFVVDRTTRDRLIREHKSSSEILKPFLRGRDVKRWQTEFAEQYLIKIESSENKDHPWSDKSNKEAEEIFAKSYPAIHSHFEKFRRELIKREDQGKYFWELRSCAYWQEFKHPKIIYQEINRTDCFAYDDSGYFANNKLFMLPNAPLEYLGFFNSRLGSWYLHNFTGVPMGGFLALQWPVIKTFPIPVVASEAQKPVARLVERILAAKRRDAEADTSALEREIDKLVYALYGLTPEEITIVRDAMK